MFQNPTTFFVLCATVVKMLYVGFRFAIRTIDIYTIDVLYVGFYDLCCRRDVSKSHTSYSRNEKSYRLNQPLDVL